MAMFEVREDAKISKSILFNNWFGDSKVVDKNGEPLTMYHGTDKEFDTFDSQERGLISFSTTPPLANGFANRDSGRVIPVYISSENPFDYTNKKHVAAFIKAIKQKIMARLNVNPQNKLFSFYM